MRIDLPTPDAWLKECERYRAALPYDPLGGHAQIYAGYQHALWEITQGLARLFPHKKTIAIVPPFEPAFDALKVAFSADGYIVKVLTTDEALEPAAVLEPLVNELAFVLFSEDDPLNGRIHEHSGLQAFLKEKRVFKLSVSHAKFRFAVLERPGIYEARVLSLNPDRALLIAGDRARVQPPVASRLPWTRASEAEVRAQLATHTSEQIQAWKAAIESFESSLPSGYQRYFKAGDSRLHDRAVFYHPEFDGLALAEEMAAAIGESVATPGQESSMETTSPCRWEDARLIEWLTTRGESEDRIRSLVIASIETISKGLATHLPAIATKLRTLQG